MPNPKDFTDQNDWMDACMHQVKGVEGKSQDEAVSQCLAIWRGKGKKKKKCASEVIRDLTKNVE